MDDLVSKTVNRSGRPVSIIGWSLGGIYARQLAGRRPEDVRQVITLAGPYRPIPAHTGSASATGP